MQYFTNMRTYISGICRHFRHSSSSLPILQQPICSLSLGSWVPKIGESNGQPFAMLTPNAPLSAALSLLVQGDFPLFSEDILGLAIMFLGSGFGTVLRT